MPRTLLVLYPKCVEVEVLLAAHFLHPKHPVVVATPDGEELVCTSGLRVRPDVSYARAEPRTASVVLVPGGDVEAVIEDRRLHTLLAEAHEAGAWIGAVCAGPLLLAAARLLVGRRFTHGFKDLHREFLAPFWEGATFVDELVVHDGRVVTAQAEGHVNFAVELAARVGVMDEREAERLRRFYKGIK